MYMMGAVMILSVITGVHSIDITMACVRKGWDSQSNRMSNADVIFDQEAWTLVLWKGNVFLEKMCEQKQKKPKN